MRYRLSVLLIALTSVLCFCGVALAEIFTPDRTLSPLPANDKLLITSHDTRIFADSPDRNSGFFESPDLFRLENEINLKVIRAHYAKEEVGRAA